VTLAEPLALASAPAAASDALDDDEEKEAEELGSPAALMRVTSRESYLRAAWHSLSFGVLGWKERGVWGGGGRSTEKQRERERGRERERWGVGEGETTFPEATLERHRLAGNVNLPFLSSSFLCPPFVTSSASVAVAEAAGERRGVEARGDFRTV
jgi:hypothetical protein